MNTTATIDHLSTEALEAAEANSPLPGAYTHPRQAHELLRLDTVERRRRALAEAHTLANLMGGILSQRLYEAATTLLANISRGQEFMELYGERTAREYREREAALREATGNPAAIYYPSARR